MKRASYSALPMRALWWTVLMCRSRRTSSSFCTSSMPTSSRTANWSTAAMPTMLMFWRSKRLSIAFAGKRNVSRWSTVGSFGMRVFPLPNCWNCANGTKRGLRSQKQWSCRRDRHGWNKEFGHPQGCLFSYKNMNFRRIIL